MQLNKWNYETHNYDKIEVPDGWNIKTYSNDMEEKINCPHCGKQIKIGDSYTSLEIHTEIGMGYGVCEKCYDFERRRKYGRVQ